MATCLSCGVYEPTSKLLPYYDEETDTYYCGCGYTHQGEEHEES